MKVELETMHLQVKNNLLKLIFNKILQQIQTTLFLLREFIILVFLHKNVPLNLAKNEEQFIALRIFTEDIWESLDLSEWPSCASLVTVLFHNTAGKNIKESREQISSGT